MNRYKLGKLPARHDPGTLKFKSYLGAVLPKAPDSIDYTGKVSDWLMLSNDTIGDCTACGMEHLEMLWSSQASVEVVPTDAQTLFIYSSITGYSPDNPDSDQGANELDCLNWWKQNSVGNGLPPISGYCSIDPQNLAHIKLAIWLFGGVYIGVQLPDNAQDQFSNGQPWSGDDSNIEGGHCIILTSYDNQYFTGITWGAKQLITPDWLKRNMEESYGIVSSTWINSTGVSPSNYKMAELTNDLKQIGN